MLMSDDIQKKRKCCGCGKVLFHFSFFYVCEKLLHNDSVFFLNINLTDAPNNTFVNIHFQEFLVQKTIYGTSN